MLLKYPEMLWGLLFLAIPILVHLIQLRKFRKTPFTNVRVLQRLVVQANRSSRLKKWLLLLCRLGLLAALVLAFAQPFTAREDAGTRREIVIYLDNSFSMEAPADRGSLLQRGVQAILQQLPGDFECAILTNSNQYSRRRLQDLREPLLQLTHSPQQLSGQALLMRAESLYSREPGVIRELWLLSDFQDLGLDSAITGPTAPPDIHAWAIRPTQQQNMSIDSAWVRSRSTEIVELEVGVSLKDPTRNKPISLYDGDTLLAKSSPELNEDGTGIALFSLPVRKSIRGSLRILDEGLRYDNNLYFNLSIPPEIRVYSIGPGPVDFLQRIYTPDEFNFDHSSSAQVDFALLEEQHLIVLNELAEIPESLGRFLVSYVQEGGALMVIPDRDSDPSAYNPLLRPLGLGLAQRIEGTNRVTEISFDHPLYQDVFEGTVTNFESPVVQSYFEASPAGATVLAYQNGLSFLSSLGRTYLFTAALDLQNSNFRQSPLIVPTLYAIGKSSMPYPELYYSIGKESRLELDRGLEADRIFQMRSGTYEFIPRQQSFARKSILTFAEEPQVDGNFMILQDSEVIGELSFNYPRDESSGNYPELDFPETITRHNNARALIDRYQNDTRITAYWKWFVILALLLAMAELLLQKLIR